MCVAHKGPSEAFVTYRYCNISCSTVTFDFWPVTQANDSESHGRLDSFDLHNNRRLLLSRSFRVSFWKNLFQCRFYTFSRFWACM